MIDVKPYIHILFILAMLFQILFFGYCSLSFAIRPEGLSRADAYIILAIYFVGFALLIDRDVSKS